jgi:hypothetical protein
MNKCSGATTPPRKQSIAEAVRTLQTHVDAADGVHAAKLSQLQSLRQVKNATLLREQSRLSTSEGAESPRVAEISQKIVVNENVLAQLQRAHERASAPAPAADENTWIVHGHVRTRDLAAVSNVTVALYTCDGQWLRQFGHDCTDDKGHFKLCVKAPDRENPEPIEPAGEGGYTGPAPSQRASAPMDTQSSRTAPGVEPAADTEAGVAKLAAAEDKGAVAPEQKLESTEGRGIYLRVTDENQALLAVDNRALKPERGRVDYREIIIGEVCTPPEGGPRGTSALRGGAGTRVEHTRFLGNSQNREVHDLQNTKRNCHIDRISPDHRVNFESEEAAVSAGYDRCAYCFGKAKSRR